MSLLHVFQNFGNQANWWECICKHLIPCYRKCIYSVSQGMMVPSAKDSHLLVEIRCKEIYRWNPQIWKICLDTVSFKVHSVGSITTLLNWSGRMFNFLAVFDSQLPKIPIFVTQLRRPSSSLTTNIFNYCCVVGMDQNTLISQLRKDVFYSQDYCLQLQTIYVLFFLFSWPKTLYDLMT